MSIEITRRDGLRGIILTLLMLVFGPGILKLIDEETLSACETRLLLHNELMKQMWGSGLQEILYPCNGLMQWIPISKDFDVYQ